MNNSTGFNSVDIVIDNLKKLKVRESIATYDQLFKRTQINPSTARNWLSHKTYPSLQRLDSFCDSFNIHTSDFFVYNSDFSHPYIHPNNSSELFKANFNSICLEKKILSVEEKSTIIGSLDLYKTYFYQNRSIPIANLDDIANRLNVETYKLLI